MSVPRLAMKKLVTFCMWCEEATTQMTRAFPTTEIREMVPYRVQSKMMIPWKIIHLQWHKPWWLFQKTHFWLFCRVCGNIKLFNLPIETLYNWSWYMYSLSGEQRYWFVNSSKTQVWLKVSVELGVWVESFILMIKDAAKC